MVQAVEKLKQESNGGGGGGITFESDKIQEFARVLRARVDQVKRGVGNGSTERHHGVKATVPGRTKDVASSNIAVKDEIMQLRLLTSPMIDNNTAEAQVEDVDM